MQEPQPIACALDAPELESRLAAVAEVGRMGLISNERVAGGHRLRFRSDPSTIARLEQVVEAERECCPFLGLALERRGDELVLSIEAPQGGEEIAAGLVSGFAGEDR